MHVKYLSRELACDLLLSDGETQRRGYVRERRMDSAVPHVVFRGNEATADGLRDAETFPDELVVSELDGSVFLYRGL